MNNTIGESFAARVAHICKEAGGVEALAHMSGLSPAVIYKYQAGKSEPARDRLVALAQAAKISIAWLATGEGPMRAADAIKSIAVETDPYPSVPRYNAAASAGPGTFIDYADVLDHIPFTQEFMHKRLGRNNTEGLIIVDASGDSMEPTISDGDLIMIDTGKHQLTAAIFAFTYEGSLFVKRLNHLPDAIEVISDNKAYAPFIIEREQMNRVHILGRVVWVGHTP